MGTLAKPAKEDRFSQLHAEHAAYLTKRIHSLQPRISPSLHADVLQDVWETVHRRIEDVPRDDLERPWLVKVLRFKLLHYARSYARTRRKEDALAPVAATKVDDGAQFESRQMLGQILGALPEEQREVVIRVELLGESANEVAEQAKVPANTVYGRLRLARARISRMGITIALWFAWLRASARDFVAVPALVAIISTIALGTIVAKDLLQAPPDSTPGPATTWQPVVHRPGPPGAPETEPLVPLEPLAPLEPLEPPVPPAPGEQQAPPAPEPQPGPSLATDPSVTSPISTTGEPPTPAPDAAARARSRQTTGKKQGKQQLTGSQRYLQLAARALRQGKGKAALRNLRTHRRKFPGHEQTHIAVAYEIEALCQLGRSEDAKAAFAKAEAFYPRLPFQIKERKKHKCW